MTILLSSSELAMAHILDPKHLSNDRDYCAALDELQRVIDADADTPAGWRVDELASLISEYEASRAAPGRNAPGLSRPAVST